MKKRILVLALAAAPLLAQTAAPGKRSAPAKPSTPAATPAAAASEVDPIIEMVQSGLSESIILKKIQRDRKVYALPPSDLVKLQRANVPEKIIEAMMDPQAAAPAVTPAAPAVPATPPEAAIPATPAAPATPTVAAAAAESAKRPGQKRIGVVALGAQGASVSGDLVALLRGDGTIMDAVPLTNKIDAYRLAEAKQKQCDYILEMSLDAKPKKQGGGFGGLMDVVKTVNSEAGSITNKNSRVASDIDRRAASADRINSKLGVSGKDKVKVAYKLYAPGAQPIAAKEQEVAADTLAQTLESTVNELVSKIVQ